MKSSGKPVKVNVLKSMFVKRFSPQDLLSKIKYVFDRSVDRLSGFRNPFMGMCKTACYDSLANHVHVFQIILFTSFR